MIFITENDYNDKYDTTMLAAGKIIKARRYILLRKLGAQE